MHRSNLHIRSIIRVREFLRACQFKHLFFLSKEFAWDSSILSIPSFSVFSWEFLQCLSLLSSTSSFAPSREFAGPLLKVLNYSISDRISARNASLAMVPTPRVVMNTSILLEWCFQLSGVLCPARRPRVRYRLDRFLLDHTVKLAHPFASQCGVINA